MYFVEETKPPVIVLSQSVGVFLNFWTHAVQWLTAMCSRPQRDVTAPARRCKTTTKSHNTITKRRKRNYHKMTIKRFEMSRKT